MFCQKKKKKEIKVKDGRKTSVSVKSNWEFEFPLNITPPSEIMFLLYEPV